MKKFYITICVLLTVLFVLCFIPFNANKFIPVVKEQIEDLYGITPNINTLVIKFGSSIVVKSPQIVLRYDKTEDFATIDGIKLKIALLPLLKNEIKIKDIRIDNINCKLKTDNNGEFLIIKQIKPVTDVNVISKVRLKNYTVTIQDNKEQDYVFKGTEFLLSDFQPAKYFKLSTKGKVLITDIPHINYDFSIIFDGDVNNKTNNTDILDFLAQIKAKELKGSIISDLKIKNTDNHYKADGVISLDKITFNADGKQLPYSNANFTFLGNKIAISSLLYTNEQDKIKINGYVTHSDVPNFNIAVKSDKIDLKDLYCFARIFSDVSNLEQVKDINGTLYSDFTLKGSLKHLKSNGLFKINNANILTDKFRINDINSDISFANNKILINTAKAYINNAPINITGEIVSDKLNINLIVDKFKLKNFEYNNLHINGGIVSVIANISGRCKNIIPRIEAELTNANGYYNKVKITTNRVLFKSASKTSGEIYASDTNLNIPNLNKIFIPSLKAKLTESDIVTDNCCILSNNSKINFQGKILDYNSDKLTFLIKGNGFINPNGLCNITILDNVYPTKIELYGNKLEQTIRMQALSQNSRALISFVQPVIMNFSAKLSDNELKIIDCSINTFKGIFSDNLKKNIATSSKLCVVTGGIENLVRPTIKNVKLNFLKPCSLNISHYMAKISGNLIINGSIIKPEIVGNIKFPIISDKYGCFTAKNISLGITKNIVNFDCPNVKIFESAISCVGVAETRLSKDIKIKTINIKSKDMDIDNLSLLLLLAKDTGINPTIEAGTMFSENVQIKTPADTLLLTDMNTAFKLKNNMLNITNLNANMYNGKIAGKIDLNTNTGDYTGIIQGRGISAGAVVKTMTNLKENICGKLDFDMDINSSIKSKLLRQANLKFIIHDGQMSTLGKVEHLLYAQNIIADNMLKTSLAVIGRAIATKDTGLFKYLNGMLTINNDVVTIKSMKMLGPNMSLYITGHYGLMSNIANATILGRLSNTIVSSLGSFGTFTMNKFKIALTGESSEYSKILQAGVENIPQLPQRNTKEFKAIISGPAEAKSSVRTFMWISETEKEYRTKEVNQSNAIIPKFIESLSY